MTTANAEDGTNRATEAVLAVLPRSVQARAAVRASGADLVVAGRPLVIKWVQVGTLGAVRQLLVVPRRLPDVVVAPRLSPGARSALSDAGVGWVDETGAAEIATGSIIVSRTGRPPKLVAQPKRWTPTVFAVAEALLCGTKATVAATTVATGLSTGSCTSALRTLTDLGLLETDAGRGRRSARRVADPERFLAAYAAAVDSLPEPTSLQVGVTWRDPVAELVEIGRKWDAAGTMWAATGAAAASVLAPYLTTVASTVVYVDTDTVVGLEAAAADAGLRPIEGGRLTLRPFPTVTAQRLVEELDGLRVPPWPRVYVDLRSVGVRGEEAAEHLREVVRGR